MSRRRDRVRIEIRDRMKDLGGRVPPNNIEAEAAVLSASLSDAAALDKALSTGLLPDEFYSDPHKRIFEGAVEMHIRSQPVDIQTVAAWLRDRDWLQAIGGISYMAKIVDATPAVAHVDAHAKIVREKARIRQLIAICQYAAAAGYGDYGDAQEFIDDVAKQLSDLCEGSVTRRGRQIYDVVRENVADLERAIDRGTAIAGYPMGLRPVDERTGGLFPGELTIVAARPGMGKTALLLEYCDHLASLPGDPDEAHDGADAFDGYACHVFSYEMPDKQLAHRRTAARAPIDVSKIRRGGIGPDDACAYINAASEMSTLPIWIYDDPTTTIMQARAILRAAKLKMPRRRHVAFFDYLQLMPGMDDAEREEQAIAATSRALKVIAGQLRMPVVAAAQLNRELEKRQNKRPMLSDLRGSGALEQDADVIQFIYRPEYYDPKPENKAFAIIDIAKQRNGPTGDCAVAYRDQFTRFENPTDRDIAVWRKERAS